MFFGTYNHQLDQKGRMRIPAKLRKDLGTRVYVMRGSTKCLYIFTEEQFNNVENALSGLALFNNEKQDMVRALLSTSALIEEDGQGRFLLSSELRKLMNIEKDIVFIGAGRKIELWSKEEWDKAQGRIEEAFEQSLSIVTADLGI